jgi:hypothetical protein
MDKLYEKLGVSKRVIEDSKESKERKIFTRYKDTVPPVPNYNIMMDLIELPTASRGYKYLLVVVDLCGNGHFDIEPLKTKSPTSCLNAIETIFKRPYVHKPYFSVVTDGGTEFKGVFDEPLTLEEFAKNINLTTNPKFKVGDTVQYKLNEPRTFLGTKNQGGFREGDKRWSVPQTIKNVFIYKGDIPYRYQLNVNPNVSYTEGQLRFYKV